MKGLKDKMRKNELLRKCEINSRWNDQQTTSKISRKINDIELCWAHWISLDINNYMRKLETKLKLVSKSKIIKKKWVLSI